MVSVESNAEGVITQAWVDGIVDTVKRLEIDALKEAARDFVHPEGDAAVVYNPVSALDAYQSSGYLDIGLTYSVRKDGRSYEDADAPLSHLQGLASGNVSEMRLHLRTIFSALTVDVHFQDLGARITVSASSPTLAGDLLDQFAESLTPLPENHWSRKWETESPTEAPRSVFIGHGGDGQWKTVRDYVKEWGYEVEAFEEEERASHTTLTVVMSMVRSSEVALIVMTAADTLTDQTKQARPNVVHELGLAQGMLGVESTIVLLEEGCGYPSNIDGHIQIRYKRGELLDVKERIRMAIEREMKRALAN